MGAGASDTRFARDEDIVAAVATHLASADAATARSLGGVFQFDVIHGQEVFSWTLDLDGVRAYAGEAEREPDATLTLDGAALRRVLRGRESARSIVQAGRCSVTGDIMRAMRLEPYLKLGDQ